MSDDPGIVAPPRRGSARGRRSVGDRLREAILAIAGDSGRVVEHSEKAWASITFAGSRHTLRLRFEGSGEVEAGEALVAALPDHEFAIPRQLVADADIVAVESVALPSPRMEVTCELPLLEDA